MEITGKTEASLRLNLDTINIILAALSSQPYERVAGLINLIQQQVSAQLVPVQQAQEEAVNQ